MVQRLGHVAASVLAAVLSVNVILGGSASAHGPAPFPGEASWDPSYVPPTSATTRAVSIGPSAGVALNFSHRRPGQLLSVGFGAQAPPGAPADLLLGALLPDGRTVLLFSRAGPVTFRGVVANLRDLPVETLAPNSGFNDPGFLQITLPSGTPSGKYLIFAAVLQQGALANNQLVVLGSDTKTLTVTSGPPDGALPILQSPFAGQYAINSPFDHFYPTEFVNTNGIIMYYWGEQLVTGAWPQSDPTKSFAIDVNHSGYDFNLPIGTPLLAAGDGTVLFAGSGSPFLCPLLNATVTAPQVRIEHVTANGRRFVTSYFHMSRIDVATGQQIVAGQPIGLSGDTGCSDYPHLHFQVNADRSTGALTDPYGWEGSFADPWSSHPEGGPSLWLWREGQEPTLFRQITLAPNPSGSTARVTITRWRWLGVDDPHNSNNEFVEITPDPRYVSTPTFDMTGFLLRNNRGDTFGFPSGFQIRVGQSARVYTGPGVNTDMELYWGFGAGVWDNTNDCARLVYPTGGAYSIRMTQVPCGS